MRVRNWEPAVRTVERAESSFKKQEVIEVSRARGDQTVDCERAATRMNK